MSSGPGWALAGDACHHKDPVIARGIADAFRDADLLASAVVAGWHGDLEASLAEYGRQRDRCAIPLSDANLWHRPAADVEPFGDLAHGGGVETLVGEQVQGDVQDPFARRCAGLIAAGLIAAGLIAAGLIAARLIAAGLIAAGLIAAGPVAAGLIIRGRGARARECCVCLCHGPILAPSRALT